MTFRVKVTPRSAKSEVAGRLADGTLKVRIAAAPERGRANEELCELLAGHFGVARTAVTILSGHSSPLKLVRVDLPEAPGSSQSRPQNANTTAPRTKRNETA